MMNRKYSQIIYDLMVCPDDANVYYKQSGAGANTYLIYDKIDSSIYLYWNHVFVDDEETRNIIILRMDKGNQIDFDFKEYTYKNMKNTIAYWVKRKLEGWDVNVD